MPDRSVSGEETNMSGNTFEQWWNKQGRLFMAGDDVSVQRAVMGVSERAFYAGQTASPEPMESPKDAWERGYDEGRSDGEKEASGGPHYPVPSYLPTVHEASSHDSPEVPCRPHRSRCHCTRCSEWDIVKDSRIDTTYKANCNDCNHLAFDHNDDNPDIGCDRRDSQGAPCGCRKFVSVKPEPARMPEPTPIPSPAQGQEAKK